MPFLGDHWVDIIVAAVLFFSIWHGWRTGFLVGIFNLLSIPLGIAAAYLFAPGLAKSTNISMTYMYAIVFFATVIGVHIVGNLLRRVLHSAVPLAKETDKLLGAVVSVVKAWVLLVLFLVVWGNVLSSSTLRSVACTAASANQLVNSGSVSSASTLGNWQTDYNTAVGNSIFANINSFVVPQRVQAKGCGS
jgi:uncharacterized membrane protein required for colicin V production